MKPKELREYFRGLSYDERREFLRIADLDDLCALLDVQPEPDPYQRFRDAIRDGKRVFTYAVNGWMIPCSFGPEIYKPDELFIEGIDIPMQPKREWLDRNEVELNGECRIPRIGESFARAPEATMERDIIRKCVSSPNQNYYSGRRWIVRPKAKKEPELERCEIKDRGNGKLECWHYNGGLFDAHDATRYINFAGFEFEDGSFALTPWKYCKLDENRPNVLIGRDFVPLVIRAKYVLFRRNT